MPDDHSWTARTLCYSAHSSDGRNTALCFTKNLPISNFSLIKIRFSTTTVAFKVYSSKISAEQMQKKKKVPILR